MPRTAAAQRGFFFYRAAKAWNSPGVDSHMEQTGCSSEILNLTPKGDHLGVAQAFVTPKGDYLGVA